MSRGNNLCRTPRCAKAGVQILSSLSDKPKGIEIPSGHHSLQPGFPALHKCLALRKCEYESVQKVQIPTTQESTMLPHRLHFFGQGFALLHKCPCNVCCCLRKDARLFTM